MTFRKTPASRHLLQKAAAAAFFLFAGAAILLLVLGKALDHDEHQFVASGALLARRSLLPYRDYPYFHTPNLVFVYGLLFKRFSYLLLTARLFSAACALAAVLAVFALAMKAFGQHAFAIRFGAGAGAGLLFMANPLFAQTSARAWNHDAGVLLVLLAFVAACAARRRARSSAWMAAVGLLLGLAVGTRLTFVTVVPAFFVMFGREESSIDPRLYFKSKRRRTLRRIIAFASGLIAGLLPVFWMFFLASCQFIFGNFQYPLLNTAFRISGGDKYGTGTLARLHFVWTNVLFQPGALILLMLLVATLRQAARSKAVAFRFERRFLPMLILYLLIGSFAPDPAFEQYFYAIIPFIVLWIVYELAAIARDERSTRTLRMPAIIAAIAVAIAPPQFVPAQRNWSPAAWAPLQAHHFGQQVRQLSGGGRVLTLHPIIPLEGGCDIYEEFTTGPFVGRIAPMIPTDDQPALHILGEGMLSAELRRRPAAAVLAGIEGDPESPLIRYATRHHATEVLDVKREKLWVFGPISPSSSQTSDSAPAQNP
ncbi:MAG TPA: hypothetical protein VH370_02260 [Humisphaera sp.]|jgi:hypothetical protein|nr:hypothetical protein [Humisphaera sp.]